VHFSSATSRAQSNVASSTIAAPLRSTARVRQS
jgi:hypothetical protein